MEHSRSSTLLAELAHFTGTQTYRRITRRHLLTDGARYLSDQAEYYWMLLASHFEIRLYACWDTEHWVIMLPREH